MLGRIVLLGFLVLAVSSSAFADSQTATPQSLTGDEVAIEEAVQEDVVCRACQRVVNVKVGEAPQACFRRQSNGTPLQLEQQATEQPPLAMEPEPEPNNLVVVGVVASVLAALVGGVAGALVQWRRIHSARE
jgi:hypothetical protein